MKKISTNLIVAVASFLLGLASASALYHNESNDKADGLAIIQSDALGNVHAHQD